MFSYDRSNNRLSWGDATYTAVSGPWGQGALPVGTYTVRTGNAVVGGLSGSFADSGGISWFIPIEALFKTTRRGLGIHPDGGTAGTEGCIGLTGADAAAFWKAWNATPMASRPTRLVVT